jgi:hypothetical protein
MTPNKNLSSLRMTRSLWILVFAFCGLIAIDTTQAQSVRDNFLVDKIYDYHNKLLAEYFYDNDNKLTKRIAADQIVEPIRTIDRKWESEFEYENGRVSKIKTYHLYIQKHNSNEALSYQQESNTETIFDYDSEGRPTRAERNFLYEDGLLVGTYGYTLGPCFYQDTIKYDNSMNVTEHVFVGPEYNMIEEPIIGTYRVSTTHYEYDDNPKPNFGLDYLFIYSPLPYIESSELQKGLSKNNMISDASNTWVYSYNEHGLPTTIETRWNGIETLNPMLLRITYKQIGETSISEVTQEMTKVNIYPNPTKDRFWIDCEGFSTITLYDMLGKEVLNQNINGKSEININNLQKGIYIVTIYSERRVIGNFKIVKQ